MAAESNAGAAFADSTVATSDPRSEPARMNPRIFLCFEHKMLHINPLCFIISGIVYSCPLCRADCFASCHYFRQEDSWVTLENRTEADSMRQLSTAAAMRHLRMNW